MPGDRRDRGTNQTGGTPARGHGRATACRRAPANHPRDRTADRHCPRRLPRRHPALSIGEAPGQLSRSHSEGVLERAGGHDYPRNWVGGGPHLVSPHSKPAASGPRVRPEIRWLLAPPAEPSVGAPGDTPPYLISRVITRPGGFVYLLAIRLEGRESPTSMLAAGIVLLVAGNVAYVNTRVDALLRLILEDPREG